MIWYYEDKRNEIWLSNTTKESLNTQHKYQGQSNTKDVSNIAWIKVNVRYIMKIRIRSQWFFMTDLTVLPFRRGCLWFTTNCQSNVFEFYSIACKILLSKMKVIKSSKKCLWATILANRKWSSCMKNSDSFVENNPTSSHCSFLGIIDCFRPFFFT